MSKFGFDFEDFDENDRDEWNDFDEMFYQMTMKGLDDDIEDEFDPDEDSGENVWDQALEKGWL